LKKIYVGAYTTRLEGQGLATLSLNGDKIVTVALHPELADPLFAALSKDNNRLYVIGTNPDGEAVCALYDATGPALRYMNAGKLGTPDCCHVELSPDERFAYAACYATGCVSVVPLNKNNVGDAIQVIQLTGGSMVNPARQDKAHAHQITIVPCHESMVNVVDLGSDTIITYDRNAQTGFLTETTRLVTIPGSGPRHVDYTPDGRYAFLAYELGNLISVLKLEGNQWKITQTLSTLPEDYNEETYCGAVRYDNETHTVYVTNRGHNSIAVFTITDEWTLALKKMIPCGGNFPRDLWLLPGGKMLTANQLSGTVALIDQEGNLLSEVKHNAAVSVIG
jgi:6-phosphogluconolactonase